MNYNSWMMAHYQPMFNIIQSMVSSTCINHKNVIDHAESSNESNHK